LSGRQNIQDKIRDAGVSFGEASNEKTLAILQHVKRLENLGFSFEGADASVHLMILHASQEYCAPFKVLDYSVQVSDANMDSSSRHLWKQHNEDTKDKNYGRKPTARATVNVRTIDTKNRLTPDNIDDPFVDRLEVSDGAGPIHALAKAMRKSLTPFHPCLENLQVVDYSVRILDPESATEGVTRVMIEFYHKSTDKSWTMVSADRNIISASLNALVDGFEYALLDTVPNAPCLI